MVAPPARSVGATPPEPVLPDFGGRCLTEVAGALVPDAPGSTARSRPDWVPEPVLGARQVVLLVLDGLGARQLDARAAAAPVLSGGTGTTVTSVAPSTTAAALTSLTTGTPPASHGVVGYRVAIGDEILNVLGWRFGGGADARRSVPPRGFQPRPPFPASERPVPVVSRQDYGSTGFTAAHLGDAPLVGWHTPSGLVVEVRRLLERGVPFVYAYYDGIDRTAHACGLGEHYEAELRAADRLVGDLLDVLPPGAALAVTADHGQVEVGASIEVLGGDVMALVTLLSGEGRFRWLHARPGARRELLDAVAERYGDIAWVRDAEQLVEDGWFGGVPEPVVRARLGDVAVVPHAPTAFLDPADTGEQRLVSRHGSLTPDEMLVPLLAFAPRP